MSRLFGRLVLLLLLSTALVSPTSVSASTHQQSATATLELVNNGTQPLTVCPFVVLQEPFTIVLSSQKITLAPNTTERFDVPPGWYIITIDDCAGQPLFDHVDLQITDIYTVQFGNPSGTAEPPVVPRTRFDCLALSLEGRRLYRRGELDPALENFAAALVCIEEVGIVDEESSILNSIALVYLDQGRYADALPNLERALVIERERGNRANEGVLLGNVGAVYHDLGRYADARTHYRRALSLAQELGDRAGEGTALNNLGILATDQGGYADALTYLQQALAIKQTLGDRRGTGQTLNNIGRVYDFQGRYPAAFDYYQQALELAVAVGAQVDIAATHNNIGGVYRAQGRYADARASYQRALAIQRTTGDRVGEGTTLNNLAVLANDQGDYGVALATHQQALSMMEAVGDQARVAIILNNIGQIYRNQRRYGAAVATFAAALQLKREIGDRAGEAVTLNNLALVADDQGDYADALTNYQAALTIMRELGNRAAQGIMLNNIGRVYAHQGRYDEALASAQRAHTIQAALGDRPSEGITLHTLGRIYTGQGAAAQARTNYQQALAIHREVGDRAYEGQTLIAIGDLNQEEGNTVAALTNYRAGIDVLEAIRIAAGDYQARTSFAESFAHAYAQVIALSAKSQPALAFWYSERGRARAFLDSIRSGEIQLSDQALQRLLTAEQAAYTARQNAQVVLAEARAANPPDPLWVSEATATLDAAVAAHAQAADAITARADQLTELIPGLQAVLQLTEVQALLPADTTLLAYWMLAEQTLAFVITTEAITTVALPDVTDESVRAAMANLYQWRNLDNPHPAPLRQLHAALIAPIADHLGTTHLAIIPHQTLHYVPFAALIDTNNGNRYWGEQYTLSSLPSANLLPYLQQNATAAQANQHGHALVIGDPTTNQANLPRLHYAAAEAKSVATLLQSAALTATAASEVTFLKRVPDARVLHLAAHGSYSQTNALASAIYLAPAALVPSTPALTATAAVATVDATRDGRLETREIFGLPLQGNDLVVLSACQTNIGTLSRGDELVGLTRAFLFAGSPTTIASLWNVDDAATEALMVAFYNYWLQDGMSKAEALQAAQADVRADPRWASPYYWAGFVLNGDPGYKR